MHVATTFSLKQGERRTSHGPIPHPLNSMPLTVDNVIVKRIAAIKLYPATKERITLIKLLMSINSLLDSTNLAVGRGDKLENFDLFFSPLLIHGRGY